MNTDFTSYDPIQISGDNKILNVQATNSESNVLNWVLFGIGIAVIGYIAYEIYNKEE